MDEHEKQEHYRLLAAHLRDLASCDEKRAAIAFAKLMARSEPYLRRYFYHMMAHDDLEDVLQLTRTKIWNARMVVGNLPVATWPNYVLTVARNCARDMWRKERPKPFPQVPETEQQEVEPITTEIMRDDDLESFLHYADCLWLGLAADVTAQTHRRQVLAAQLHYLDAEPLTEIIELLPPAPAQARLTEAVLQQWLTDDGVIRALAFRHLFYTPDRLAWRLLGRRGPVKVVELDALSGAACGLGGPVTPEVAVILWRYRYTMRPDEILARKDCPLDQPQLSAMLASLDNRLPFNSVMETLIQRLNQTLGADRVTQILGTAGLWQRLAFQYHYVTGPLSLPDVCTRLKAPAQQVGYDVTSGNLNVWLSGKRLITRLSRYIALQQSTLQQSTSVHQQSTPTRKHKP